MLSIFPIPSDAKQNNYPIKKTQKLVGELPYSLNEGVLKTLDWMYEEKLISFKNS